jgi:hypothetical protein
LGEAGGGYSYSYIDNPWRPVYQATPWNPPLAPIQPMLNFEQVRPRAAIPRPPPSFMYRGQRFVIVD